MIRLLSIAWLALLGLGCAGIPLTASPGEETSLPRQLQARQLIITLRPASPEVWASLAQDLSRDYGLPQVGAFPLSSLGVQCVVFQLTEDRPIDEVLARLAADPRVESVQVNQSFRGLLGGAADPYASLQYGVRAVRADRVHAWVTGKGVRVAIVDTGVDTEHPDLKGRLGRTINFVEGGEKTFTSDRHGTAVAGIIGSRAGNEIGIVGIAPDAELLAAKACWHREARSAEAWCSSWTLAKAIDFAIIERVQVLNLSLAGPSDPLLVRLIAKAVEEQGITVIAAMLENGDQALSFPANLSTVVGVLASDLHGSVRAPTGRGQAFLAAPGVEVLTTLPQRAYDFLTGSSLAAAHVSGVVALLLEQNPNLSPRDMKELLLATARPSSKNTGTYSSFGHVDACAALQRLVQAARCH